LNSEEEAVFQEPLARIEPSQEEEVMEIVTSWMREGIQRRQQQEALSLVMRLLTRRFGSLTLQLQEQIQSLPVVELENLGEALLDFSTITDLES
jgi:predicted transposase YdaD